MTYEQKNELVKKLESLVILQKNFLTEGAWDDYDKVEGEIKKIENEIVYTGNTQE